MSAYGGGQRPLRGTELSFDWPSPLPFADHSGSLGPYGGLEGARDPAGTEPLSPQEDEALQIGELGEDLDCP